MPGIPGKGRKATGASADPRWGKERHSETVWSSVQQRRESPRTAGGGGRGTVQPAEPLEKTEPSCEVLCAMMQSPRLRILPCSCPALYGPSIALPGLSSLSPCCFSSPSSAEPRFGPPEYQRLDLGGAAGRGGPPSGEGWFLKRVEGVGCVPETSWDSECSFPKTRCICRSGFVLRPVHSLHGTPTPTEHRQRAVLGLGLQRR